MSKRFEKRKEAALRINEFYSALNQDKQSAETEISEDWKSKYSILYKRYQDLEKVFAFHRGIVQTISSGLITTNHSGIITFINQATSGILGYHSRELLGQHVMSLFADRAEGEKISRQIFVDHNMCESKETQLKTKNEEIVPIGFSTTPLSKSEQDKEGGFIFIFRNISMVNNLKKQIERMDRMAILGELSAGIAHEIRNPLAGIKTSAQVLEESFSPGDFRSELVLRIVKEIDRSNELLKQFFNFAKPNRPKQDFYNIEMIIDGVYLLLAPRLKKKNIIFHKNFNEEIPQVYIDEGQLEQVVLNLFINAIESMKTGGQLEVETIILKNVNLSENKSRQKSVCVRITDTGIGISRDIIEKIFNPFFTTKSDGVGLGLSISTRLLEENGGKIEVESTPGSGSIFSIYLPLVQV